MLDEGLRNRHKRNLDLAKALTDSKPDWGQIDELEALQAELEANNAAAEDQYDKLVTEEQREDALLKAEKRTEGVRLTMQVRTGLLAWATAQGAAQAALKKGLEKIVKSTLDAEDELDYAQLVSWVYTQAKPVKAQLVKYYVPEAVTEALGALHTAFETMRGNGRLTQTEAATARKLLRAALSANDARKTGVLDRMRVYVNALQYGKPATYENLTRVMQTVDRRGRPRKVKGEGGVG